LGVKGANSRLRTQGGKDEKIGRWRSGERHSRRFREKPILGVGTVQLRARHALQRQREMPSKGNPGPRGEGKGGWSRCGSGSNRQAKAENIQMNASVGSLCRIGTDQLFQRREQRKFRLGRRGAAGEIILHQGYDQGGHHPPRLERIEIHTDRRTGRNQA